MDRISEEISEETKRFLVVIVDLIRESVDQTDRSRSGLAAIGECAAVLSSVSASLVATFFGENDDCNPSNFLKEVVIPFMEDHRDTGNYERSVIDDDDVVGKKPTMGTRSDG